MRAQLQGGVKVEKIQETIFKFCFSAKEDKDQIFSRRPLSMDGAHLILKEWSSEEAIQDIAFKTTTFHLQVHGLPPKLLHPGVAMKIGNQIGGLHASCVNSHSVGDGNEVWIQFKYERLSDLYFGCGLMDHVAGKCKFTEPGMIKSSKGVVSQLYGLWLWEGTTNGITFSNLEISDNQQRQCGRGGLQCRQVKSPRHAYLVNELELENMESIVCRDNKEKIAQIKSEKITLKAFVLCAQKLKPYISREGVTGLKEKGPVYESRDNDPKSPESDERHETELIEDGLIIDLTDYNPLAKVKKAEGNTKVLHKVFSKKTKMEARRQSERVTRINTISGGFSSRNERYGLEEERDN
ncbi:hypothetical protein FNV43_RR02644 [Rhamnella rubrinervis]|uniref:Zinc knuckle CX2CX4HX4C domain-containing protein n=1 Tax=Rhamnella rubrinervis TaxID=2594499 RepID=A0A8K0HRT7_9ROSA|nr:hypothetical protein FNV43_RR02644 [Rhamnella rubrinervis]